MKSIKFGEIEILNSSMRILSYLLLEQRYVVRFNFEYQNKFFKYEIIELT